MQQERKPDRLIQEIERQVRQGRGRVEGRTETWTRASVAVDGDAVSVYPSIGNWSFPCKSHYWINCGQISWAEQWSEAQIRYGRQRDRIAKQRQYGEGQAGLGFWARLWRFITGR